MISPSALEILDLRHFGARQLRPLLTHEAALWERALRWDYASATELLLQYIDSQVLTGFAAVDDGAVSGFAFAVFEGQKAVIGDAFSNAAFAPRKPSLRVTEQLLTHLMELLRATPMVHRIESQLLLYDAGALDVPFRRDGFEIHPRLFLECDLDRTRLEPTPLAPEGLATAPLSTRRWQPNDFQAAAELIHAAYLGHVDAQINDQYRTLHGSLRFLHNIVRFPGCGVFEPQHSWCVENPATGRIAAMILCSRVSADVAHVTQLCVQPALRGHRLGRQLLRHTIQELARAGYAALTLTVTESNTRAVTLYRDLGFTLRHRFDAAVLELLD